MRGGEVDLVEVEKVVAAALEAGHPGRLDVLGYGEITLVLGWPAGSPRWALKRLPVFDDLERLRAYQQLLYQYIRELKARGLSVADSEFAWVEASPRGFAAYVIQPVYDHKELLVAALASNEKESCRRLFSNLVECVVSVVDEQIGLDAQVSNWALCEESLQYFDISTPLMRDAKGRSLLDVDVFLASLPALLRLPVKVFVADSILATYFDKRSVLLDVAANFYKDGIEHLIPLFIEVIGNRVSPPITKKEAYRYHRRDALVWSSLQRARRADRFWQRYVRRKQYPYLLPPSVYAGRRA